MLEELYEFVNKTSELHKYSFCYSCSSTGTSLLARSGLEWVDVVDVKKDYMDIVRMYELVISMHCKQIFPEDMVRNVRCVNIHPGLNPYNRGWYPQVFAIMNKMPHGATIHEIDADLDHGPIIAQQEVPVFDWDTSRTVYDRVQSAEMELMKAHLVEILENKYERTIPFDEGNINYIKDFKKLCHLDLDEKMTLGAAIDLLRALTHPPYRNAWFESFEGENLRYNWFTL